MQIRASLKDDPALVLTSLPPHLIQTRIDAGTTALHVDALPRDQLAKSIETFRETIQNEEEVANAAGARLSQRILSRLNSQGVPKRLVLVADGPLVTLTFGALPLILGGQQSYLGVHSGLSPLPSLTLLTATGASDKASVGSRVFLGVGDARYSPDAAERTLGFVPSDLRETQTERLSSEPSADEADVDGILSASFPTMRPSSVSSVRCSSNKTTSGLSSAPDT